MISIFKRFFTGIFMLPLLLSCTTHYIAIWQNDDPHSIPTPDGNYAVKNDTIGIAHAFNSVNGKVMVRMENYSDQSILVNLTKSAMTINGRTFGYVDGKATMYGRYNQFGNVDTNSMGFFDGEIHSNTNTLYIPPMAFVESEFTDIIAETQIIVGEDFGGQIVNNQFFDETVNSRTAFYEKETSPMILKSIINYSVLDKNNQPVKTDIITQNFYMSSYSKVSNQSRSQMDQLLASRKEMSAYSITRGQTTALVLGLVGLGVIIASLDINEMENWD